MGSIRRFMGSTGDADAAAFILAAGLTDSVQIAAINTLVIGFKDAGIWSKMKAIYPFVGGTAASHKWNLKDPRDFDVAFRLQFIGEWLHSSNGVNTNSSTIVSYARTFFVPSLDFTKISANISIYLKSFLSAVLYSVPIGGGALNSFIQQTAVPAVTVGLGNTTYLTSNGTNTGLISSNRVNTSDLQLIRNGNVSLNSANSFASYSASDLYIGNYTNTTQFQSRSIIAIASLGDGLTEAESSNLYAIVQAYQTTLGRQV